MKWIDSFVLYSLATCVPSIPMVFALLSHPHASDKVARRLSLLGNQSQAMDCNMCISTISKISRPASPFFIP
jgi:hypothetical protein